MNAIPYRQRIFSFDDFLPDERRKYLVVVIYDIPDNKRRAHFSKFLEGFGVRVQKSAFECVLSGHLYEKLISEIPRYLTEEDLIRVYKLSGNADIRAWGHIPLSQDSEVTII